MVLATHEMGFAREVASRSCFLADGVVCEEGPPEQIFSDPATPPAAGLPPSDHRGRPALASSPASASFGQLGSLGSAIGSSLTRRRIAPPHTRPPLGPPRESGGRPRPIPHSSRRDGVQCDHDPSTPAHHSVTDLATQASVPRTYVLDTSVLLADPRSLVRFDEHEVVLPIVVITELEAKRDHPELGWAARAGLAHARAPPARSGSLTKPLPVNDAGGTLRVELNHQDAPACPPR